MTFPGPPPGAWGVELLALAVVVAAAGEGGRRLLARFLPFFAAVDPIERGLLDLYLAGAALTAASLLPGGAFGPPAEVVLLGGGGVLCAADLAVGHRRGATAPRPDPPGRTARWAVGVALASALALFAVELAAAGTAATGNTYDSSVDALFVALLNHTGAAPFSLAPVAPGSVANPPGTPVWLSLLGGVGGLPPARTALLVTPLFLALVPLGAYRVGCRWAGGPLAGAAYAVGSALLLPGARYLAGGNNDFLLALPLGLLLAARAADWAGPRLPGWRYALTYGVMSGALASISPVPAEWLFLLLPIAAALGRPAFAGRWLAWGTRWAAAVAVALLWVAPSLLLLLGTGGGAAGGGTRAVGPGAFVAYADPFLFTGPATLLGPFELLRAEVAGLLAVGVVVAVASWSLGRARPEGRYLLAGGIAAIVGLAAGLLPSAGPASVVLAATSPYEMAVLLATVYGFAAIVPLALLLEMATRPSADARRLPPPGEPADRRPARPPGLPGPRGIALLAAVVLVVPGAAVTAGAMPAYLGGVYAEFSNVTADDFALFAWAPAHLPDGARVLVAPGSAAEFLPAYDARLVVLFPMAGPDWTRNASYLLLRASLPNGTLGPAGAAAIAALGVDFVVVTARSTVLFPAFSPAPFLVDPSYRTDYHAGDAYVFERTGA